jgi:hypothetical protein
MLVTAASLLIAVLSFVVVRRRGLELDQLEQKIPDAARYEDLQHRLLEAEDQWTECQEKIAGAQDLIAEARRAQEWLEKNQILLTSVEAERQQQESLRAELEEVQRRLTERQQQMETLSREAAEAEFRMNTARETAEKLESSVAALETRQSELKQDVAQLEVEHKKLVAICEQDRELAKKAEEELARLEKQRDELDKENKELRQLRAELTGEVSGLEKTKERLLVDTGKQKDRLADLWAPVFDHKSDGIMPDEERSCLQQVMTYIGELGLIFPERVMHAFHTSLKVADISPLVVLAGISGTGKSELPFRYAQGMGMHFLNLAVQPRWDSPQDMFGFFNYIEGRYRATELARALVQMDPYFEEDDRGWDYPKGWESNSICDQMLLVLLDEMNLARVEYYFSEFLSRLEIRRGINPDDAMDRRKAEVPLEVGGAGGAGSLLRLFVHTNVLFVGTMNEDETTQSLSDKVVDRANVMRFGKPSRFQGYQTDSEPAPNKLAMPVGTWEEWLKDEEDLSHEHRDQIDTWIVRLNYLMDRIHRPFAHRTYQAIRKYVANYPIYDDFGIRLAVADQIEQKILPKFRGLDAGEKDVGESLDDLIGLIRDLNDTKLADAVERARSEEEHLFVWQGVDRMTDGENT